MHHQRTWELSAVWQTTDSVFLPYRETRKPLVGTKLQGDMPGHCGSAPNLLYNFRSSFSLSHASISTFIMPR